jgi:alkylation response protein AidB-like acyl-CoA dehydrogenase
MLLGIKPALGANGFQSEQGAGDPRRRRCRISSRFGNDYWLKRDHDGGLPQEFVAALAQNGWLGICIPEEYRGRPGILDAGLMIRTIAESGAGMSGAPSSALYRRMKRNRGGTCHGELEANLSAECRPGSGDRRR